MSTEPTGERINPCLKCGEHVNDRILSTSPECPHGWEPATSAADLVELCVEAWEGEKR